MERSLSYWGIGWVLEHPLEHDLHLNGWLNLSLFVRSHEEEQWTVLRAKLYDYNGTDWPGRRIGGQGWTWVNSDDWYREEIGFSFLDHTISKGDMLVLIVDNYYQHGLEIRWGGADDLAYMNFTTDRFLAIDGTEVVDENGAPASTFVSGDRFKVRSGVTDPFGDEVIKGAFVDITGPDRTPLWSDVPMDRIEGSDVSNGTGFEKVLTLADPAPIGVYNVTVTVHDIWGWSRAQNISFEVLNLPPEILELTDFLVDEDSPPWVVNLTNITKDLEDGPGELSFSLEGGDLALVEAVLMVDQMTFRPVENAFGNARFALVVHDTDGASTMATFWVNVTPVNDPPFLTAKLPDQKKQEDDPGWEINLAVFGSDMETDTDDLTWSLGPLVGECKDLLSSVVLEVSVLRPDLNRDRWGTCALDLTLTDRDAGKVQGQLTIDVAPVNDPPVWSKVPRMDIIDEDDLGTWVDLADFVSDVDDGPEGLSFFLVEHDAGPEADISLSPQGVLTIGPMPIPFSGLVRITVEVGDQAVRVRSEVVAWVDIPAREGSGGTEEIPCRLEEPRKGEVLEGLEPELRWVGAEPREGGAVVYDVYLSMKKEAVETLQEEVLLSKGQLGHDHSIQGPLDPDTTYYWTVTWRRPGSQEAFRSDVWWFDTPEGEGSPQGPTETSEVRIWVHPEQIGSEPGQTSSARLYLDSTLRGSVTVALDIEVPAGIEVRPSDHMVEIAPSGMETIVLDILVLKGTPADIYSVVVHINYEGENGGMRVSGNATGQFRVVVKAPLSQGDPTMGPEKKATQVTASGFVIMLVLLGVGTEVGRFQFLKLLPFLPFYSRLHKEDLFNNLYREKIFRYIEAHPGVHIADLKRNMKIKNGVMAYHLSVLQRNDLIISKIDGQRRRLYPAKATPLRKELGNLSWFQVEIVDLIKKEPGITPKAMSKELDKSKQILNYHLNLLMSSRLVYREKEGGRSNYFIDPKVLSSWPLVP